MQDASEDRRQPARVLIVETDEERAREFHRMLMGAHRIQVQWVTGKLAAFERLKSWQPQLILINDDLNGHSGLEVTLWIRKYSHVPIMVVTDDDSFDYYLQILNSGADGCFYHPIPAQLLTAQILALLRRSYRYSAIVEVPQSEFNSPTKGFRSTTNTPPMTNGATNGGPQSKADEAVWPTCSICSYMGPPGKFEAVSASGVTTMRCPACSSSFQLRYPVS